MKLHFSSHSFGDLTSAAFSPFPPKNEFERDRERGGMGWQRERDREKERFTCSKKREKQEGEREVGKGKGMEIVENAGWTNKKMKSEAGERQGETGRDGKWRRDRETEQRIKEKKGLKSEERDRERKKKAGQTLASLRDDFLPDKRSLGRRFYGR